MSPELFHLIADLNTEVTVPADGIISRTVYQDDNVKAVLFGFAPGQELSEHTASMPGIMQFLRGTAQVTVAEHKQNADSGMWIYMQPNVPHSIIADTEVVMLLLLIKAAKVRPV